MYCEPTSNVTFLVETVAEEVCSEIYDLAKIDLDAAGVDAYGAEIWWVDCRMELYCRDIEAERIILRLLRARASDPGGDIVRVDSHRLSDLGERSRTVMFDLGADRPYRP